MECSGLGRPEAVLRRCEGRAGRKSHLVLALAKDRVHIPVSGRRSAAGSRRKRPFCCQEPGRTHESTPGRPRESSADANPPHAKRRDIAHRQLGHRSDQQVHRLGRDCRDNRGNFLACTKTRGVQAIGACVRIGPNLAIVSSRSGRPTRKHSARPTSSVAAAFIDCTPRRTDPLDCRANIVEGARQHPTNLQ